MRLHRVPQLILTSSFVLLLLCAAAPSVTGGSRAIGPVEAHARSAPMADIASDQTAPAARGLNASTALNWAGYVSSSGTYSAVSGTWTIPSVGATSAMADAVDATWVGIGGVRTHDLLQVGTEAIPDGSGGFEYHAWYELLPDPSQIVPLSVHAGDIIRASLSQLSEADGTWRITIADLSTGKSYATDVTYESSRSSAEWIEEVPAGVGTQIVLDDFGSVAFSEGSAVDSGVPVSIAGSGASPLTMANDAQQTVAIPSPIGADGGSFTVTKTGAQSTAMAIGIPTIGRMLFIIPLGGQGADAIAALAQAYSEASGMDLPYHAHRSFTIFGDGGTYSIQIY